MYEGTKVGWRKKQETDKKPEKLMKIGQGQLVHDGVQHQGRKREYEKMEKDGPEKISQ